MDKEKIIEMLDFEDDIIINEIFVEEDKIYIHLELKRKTQICPKCKSKVNRVNDYYIQEVKHLDMFEKKTFLILKKRRYRCRCGKAFQEENMFLNKNQRFTRKMFKSILEALGTEYSFTSVGRIFGMSVNTIIRAFDRVQYHKADLSKVEVMGIDEFKGNTGGEVYNVILVDPKTRRVIDILECRKYDFLSDFFAKMNRSSVKIFISDMWKPYKEIAQTFFKKAMFVTDKYHWIRQIIWAFENVRKEEQKIFYKTDRIYFKRSKSLLKKRFEFLSDEQKQEVNIMLYKSIKISTAHTLKDNFLKILECKDKKEAKENLEIWIASAKRSGLEPFEKCADTMRRWKDGILNSFDTPHTNGFAEGCNNKIKVLKRNAYGYQNFKRFRNRILHMFRYNKSQLCEY